MFLAGSPLTFAVFTLFAVVVASYYVQAQVFLSEGKGEIFLLTSLIYGAGEVALVPLVVSLSSWGLIAANGVGFLLASAVGILMIARTRPAFWPRPVIAAPPSLDFIRFSLVNQATNLLLILPNLVLPIMAVNFLGKTAGAHFFLAWMIGFFAISISFAFDIAFFVYGSRSEESDRHFRTALGLAVGVSIAAAAFLVLASGSILAVFGEEYRQEGVGLLRFVALAAIPGMVAGMYIGRLRVRKANLELIVLMTTRTALTIAVSAFVMATSQSMTTVGFAFFLIQLAAAGYAAVRLAGWRGPPERAAGTVTRGM
jgi:O-antigen/teichoic acid export membrane protein